MSGLTDTELIRNSNIRLCCLCVWQNFEGLGFKLESSQRPPHIVRLIESNSPAAAGGLKIRDYIITVNQQDVSEADYAKVRDAIKNARDGNVPIELLVVEQRFYQALKERNIKIDNSFATTISTPTTMPIEYQHFPKHLPRTCDIQLNKSDSTFGFEFVGGENDVGAYIQEVFPNTPASRRSLRKCDRIIEIDDIFVDEDASKFILEKLVKAKAKRAVKLYVVDTETHRHFQLNKIPLSVKREQNSHLEDSLSTINCYDTNERESPTIDDQPQSRPSSATSTLGDILTFRTPSVPDLTRLSATSTLDDILTFRTPSVPDLTRLSATSTLDDILTFRTPSVPDLTRLSPPPQLPPSFFISTSPLPLTDDEDIRLCTVNRADASDTFGIELSYHPQEQYPSLSILPGRNDGPPNAELAGIKTDDRLIEINGQNIQNLDFHEVLQRIRAVKYPEPLQLLVADTPTYEYYDQQQILIHRGLPNVNIIPPNNHERSYSSAKSSRRCSKQISDDDGNFSGHDVYYFEKYDLYDDDDNVSQTSVQTSSVTENPSSPINVCKGDLITQRTDVIVVCASSQSLFSAICSAGGDPVLNSYRAELKRSTSASVIAVKADGQLASKRVYFLPWTANSDTSILRQFLKKIVSYAINKAAEENYQSITFPAIGCGQYGCSISLVAQVMVRQAQCTLRMHNISVWFVIEPERTDIYDEFQKQIDLIQPKPSSNTLRQTNAAVGVMEVEKGDITMQQVDVIIGSSSSANLRKAIITAAGDKVQAVYDAEFNNHPNSVLIVTPPGSLLCKKIFFVKWQPDTDEEVLRESLVDLILTVVQHMKSHKFSSIAFPAIGCGQHGCSVNIIVQTMVKEMKTQLSKRNLGWTVKFVVQPDQENIYEEFCKQVLTTNDGPHGPNEYQLPSTWEETTGHKIRFVVSTESDEYKSVITNFDQAMTGNYTEIIKIERIQNERWYMQYSAHSEGFRKRFNTDTEERLYHGCPEQASNSIIDEGFNRFYASGSVTLYGYGVTFSSDATYSHRYAVPNENGERCMFVARVLVGRSTVGDTSMKTRPVGFDSTTGLDHIFVTYHDAQAFAEYLITYK